MAAASISGASLAPIYDRLNGAANYHPLSAETFADWSLQAGDIVTVTRDGRTYQSPVHTAKMTWKGTPVCEINASGNKNREPVTKISKKKYGGGAAGMNTDQGLYRDFYSEDGLFHTTIEATETHAQILVEAEQNRASGIEATLSGRITVEANRITQEVADRENGDITLAGRITVTENAIEQEVVDRQEANSELSGRITTEANRITQEVTIRQNSDQELSGRITTEATRITQEITNRENGYEYLSGRITTEANRITQEVTNRERTDVELQGSIETMSDKISLVVTESAGEAVVNAASIVLGINNQTGSYTTIQANKINLNGYVKATDITTDYISAIIAQIENVGVKRLTSERGGISVYSVGTTSFTQGGVDCYVPNAVENIRITGPTNNVYTLQRKRFDDGDWVSVGSFSRATSLSGSWSGGRITVTATPQGETYSRLLGQGSSSEVTWNYNSKVATIPIKAHWGDSGQYTEPTGWSASVYYGDKLEDINITQNGSYSASDGYVGFGNVNVNVTTASTTLTGSWSTNTYTVTAEPQGLTKDITVNTQFVASNGQYYVQTYQTNLPYPFPIQGTGKTYKLGLSGTTVQVQNASGGQWGSTPTLALSSYLQTKSITQNGTYTPDEGKIGFGSVTVNVPDGSSVVLTGSWSGKYYNVIAKIGNTVIDTESTSISLIAQGGGTSAFTVAATTIGSGGPPGDIHASATVAMSRSGSGSNTTVLGLFGGNMYGTLSVGDLYTSGMSAGEAKFSHATVRLEGASDTVYKEIEGTGTYYYKSASQSKVDRGASEIVTKIGTQTIFASVSITPVGTSGTYYQSGVATTYYQAGTVTKYDRGSSVTITQVGTPTIFASSTVTPIGASGTYYNAGTATTYYNAGTTTKYARGDSIEVTPIGAATVLSSTTIYRQGASGTYYYTASEGTTYYKAGTAATYYKGNGGSFTVQGEAVTVTPVGTGVRLTEVTRYTQGTAGTYYNAGTATTYYKGDGGSFTVQGTAVSVTPIGGSVTRYTLGTAGTYYNPGTTATYYKGNGGTYTVQGTSTSVTPVGTSKYFYTYNNNAKIYLYKKNSDGTYTSAGSRFWFYATTSGGGTFYKGGTATTYYKAGTTTVTARGDAVSVTPIGTSVTRYTIGTAGTYYNAGTAKTYYNAGTTTKYDRGASVSVTPIGTSVTRYTAPTSGTYLMSTSNGTQYYKAGTATTYYKAGTTTKYARGDTVSVTPIGTATTFASGTRYAAGESVACFVTVASGTSYYKAGTKVTYYKGNGGSFTVQGTSVSVTPIGTSVTRYAAGPAMNVYVTGSTGTKYYLAGTQSTYYRGDGGEFTVQGASVQVTPIGSSVTRYTAGTSGTYYRTASEGTAYYRAGLTYIYYKGDGGTFTPIDANSAKRLTQTTRYTAGTTDSTTYYTKTS